MTGLTRAPPRPAQALSHAGHGVARPDLRDCLDVAHVDAELECRGANDGGGPGLVLHAPRGFLAVLARQVTVVGKEFLRHPGGLFISASFTDTDSTLARAPAKIRLRRPRWVSNRCLTIAALAGFSGGSCSLSALVSPAPRRKFTGRT